MDIKTKKLNELKLEVKDFHPVLHAIFKGMPKITAIDYKQGNQEFGSDFVLTRFDDDLGDTEYIAIVAKVTAITQSDREIDRQIDECQHMSKTVCGKKSIYISEIWVMTTKNISQNAQDLFTQKYKSSKIKFFDSGKIINLIDKFAPSFWNDIPIQISNHLIKIKEKIETIEKNTSLYMLNTSDIVQELIKIDNDDYDEKFKKSKVSFKNQRFTIQKICNKTGIAFIEGSMGSGKSHLLRKTTLFYADFNNFNEYKTIPIYIQLKDLYHNYDCIINNLIEWSLDGLKIDKDIKVLLLIDGADEFKSEKSNLVDIIKNISNQSISYNVKIIIAGRDINIFSTGDKALKIINRYQISTLSAKQVLLLIEKTCANLNIKNRIANDLTKSSLFKALPRTPIAAVLLTKLLQENHGEIPSNLTELYAKYTELALGRWDTLKGLQSEKEYEASRKIIINIACYLLDNDLSCISIDEAKSFFSEYLKKRNLGIEIEHLFKTVIDRSDLVSIDIEANTFSFRHRTFAEFFYACNYFLNKSFDPKEESFDLYWGAITFFYVGIIKDCPEVLQKLSILEMENERTQILKILNMGNILLAAHQTPYETITIVLKNIFIESSKYFYDLKHKNRESPLSSLPEMQLLCLFRHIISENYGYDYFKDAIYQIMIEIEDDQSLSLEIKSYALFFLETSAMSFTKRENIFESMIERLGNKNIPLNVQLAIKHESNDSGITNNTLNRIFRNIRKLAQEKSVQKIIKDMYEKPLKRLRIT